TRSASLALYSGTTLLGWLPVASGHSARWYALTIPAPPTPVQAANLYLVVAPGGNASTAVNVYAGYVDLQTDAPEPPASPSPDTTSSPGSPTDGTQNATAGSGPSDSLLAATIGPIKALTAKPSGVVRVPVTCPAI